MAVEARLVAGQPLLKPMLRQGVSSWLSIGDFAYSGLWSISALLAKAFSGRAYFLVNYSLIHISKWLVPIIWSAAFPLLLFYLGRSLEWSNRRSLFLVWLSALPFALQATGSLTLPSSLGFLWWLGGLVILVRHFAQPTRRQLWALGGIGLVLIFNHTLYLILFILIWALAEILRWRVAGKFLPASVIILTLAVAVTLPAVEWGAGYLEQGSGRPAFASVKQLLGNLTAVYLASGPRPHDIAIGNILFNQIPGGAFVANFFTAWRWWLPVFALLFWAGVIYGLIIAWRSQRRELLLVMILTMGLSISYVAARYWLDGEQILNRRLDPVLAFLSVVSIIIALPAVAQRFPWRRQRAAGLVGLVILSSAITASYSLGPDLPTVSRDEYRAMQYVGQQEEGSKRHCVIADTMPLLALEAISGREVIGGGFPIDQYFAQPELARFRAQLDKGFFEWDSETAYQLTGSQQCWWVKTDAKMAAGLARGPGPVTNVKIFGKTVVVRYTQANASYAPPAPQDFWPGIVPLEVDGRSIKSSF